MAVTEEDVNNYLHAKNRWVEFPIQSISAIPDYVPGSEKLRIYFMWDDAYIESLAYPDYPDIITNSRYRTPPVEFDSASIKDTWFNAVGDTITFYGGSYIRCNRVNLTNLSTLYTKYGKDVKAYELYAYNPSGNSVAEKLILVKGGSIKTSNLPTHMSQAYYNLGSYFSIRMIVDDWSSVLNAFKNYSELTSSSTSDYNRLNNTYGIRRNPSYNCVYSTVMQDRLYENTSSSYKAYMLGDYDSSPATVKGFYNFLVGLGEGTMKKGSGEGTGETTSNNNPSKPSGGQGDFDGSYDTDPSDKDSTDDLQSPSIKAGLRTYILDETGMQGFHDFMFADAFNNTWDSIRKVFGKPQDAITGFNALFIPNITNAPTTIKIGNIDTNIPAGLPTSQWVKFDCGTVNVYEAWGGFLDYPPYTSASLYLPFCGTIELPVDEIMNAEVSVTYNIDITTGSCVASVYSNKPGGDDRYSPTIQATIARTQGNIGMQIPWSAADSSRQLAAIGQIAAVAIATSVSFGTAAVAGAAAAEAATTTAAAGVATGEAAAAGAAATATGIASKATGAFIRNAGVAGATIANNIGHIPYTTVTRGGTAQNVFGVLQSFTPYLLITRPIQSYPQNYQHYHGLPSNITSKIGDLEGYTQVAAIELDDIPGITPTEIAMLHETLTTGFYI